MFAHIPAARRRCLSRSRLSSSLLTFPAEDILMEILPENTRYRRMKRQGPILGGVRTTFLSQMTRVYVRNVERLAGTSAVDIRTGLRTGLRSEASRNVDLVRYVFGILTIPVTVTVGKMMIGLQREMRALESVTQYRQTMAAPSRQIAEVRKSALGEVSISDLTVIYCVYSDRASFRPRGPLASPVPALPSCQPY